MSFLLLFPACGAGEPPWGAASDDADHDGYPAGEDCLDVNPFVHPGADELCNQADDDCDGEVDEGVSSTFYVDQDGDGYGAAALQACEMPEGAAAIGGDCGDIDDGTFPGAAETCDGEDDDCDGEVDEAGASGGGLFYKDADGDGYGDPGQPTSACDPPAGYVEDPGDCDDTDASVSPLVTERCACADGADNDGDGLIDCEDGECAAEGACQESCSGEEDEDADGLTDCEDDDCWGTFSCVEVRMWVEAGYFEGSSYHRAGTAYAWGRWNASRGASRWSRAWSVQGGISRRSPHLGLATTCAWTLDSASWSTGSGRWHADDGVSTSSGWWSDAAPVERSGIFLSPDCPANIPVTALPELVVAGKAGWGDALYSYGGFSYRAAWWAPNWYVPGSWNSARVASTAYDPAGWSELWLSTHRTTWRGALARGTSYYEGPP